MLLRPALNPLIAGVACLCLARPALGQSDTCATLGLPPSLYRSVLNAQFSALLGSAQAIPGSFGSLEIDKEQKVKLAASSQPGGAVVAGLEVAGGVDNGILRFIDSRQSSSTFSALLKFHWLRASVSDEPEDTDTLATPLKRAPNARVAWISPQPRPAHRSVVRKTLDALGSLGQNQLEYTNSSCHAYLDAARRAGDSLRVRLAAAGINAPDVERRLASAKAAAQIRADSNKLADPTLSPVIRDSLLVDIARATALKAIADSAVIPKPGRQRLTARQRYSAELRAAQQALKVTGFQMPWLSLTVGVINTSFKHYNSLAVFDSQFVNDSYASPSLGLSASVYKLSTIPGGSFFLTAGITGSFQDNLGELRKIDFTDTKQYGPNPDDRVAKKSVTAYAGDYEDNLGALAFNIDWYHFLFRDNQGAIHIFPAVAVKESVSPLYTTGVGFLWTVRKQDASVFNAELFFKLTDIGESTRSDDNVWERSQLGLRMSFPILFSPR